MESRLLMNSIQVDEEYSGEDGIQINEGYSKDGNQVDEAYPD